MASQRITSLEWARLGLLVALAAVFIGLPLQNLLFKVYAWHIEQPEFLEGGLELLAFFGVLSAAVLAPRLARFRPWFALALAALYLERNSVLVPVLAAVLYLETLIQLGRWVLDRLRVGVADDLRGHLLGFVTGVAVWTCLALVASAVGFGTFAALRWMTLGLALVSLVGTWPRPLTLTLARAFQSASRAEGGLVAFLGMVVLAQMGKVNPAFDYDSAWYGLRPEQVLVGDHSFTDDLKLAHFVYFYPKQFELLCAPLSGLGEHAFIVSFNVLVLGLAFVAFYRLARELDVERAPALALAAIISTLPAFANMASTGKVDNLLHCLAFIAAFQFAAWAKSGERLGLVVGSLALLLMLDTKVTAYAYVPLVAAGFGVARWVVARRAAAPVPSGPPGRELVLVGAGALAFLGLTARTWFMTGLPTMPVLVGLWRKLGFQPRYPWTLLDDNPPLPTYEHASQVGAYWLKLLFDPDPFVHYMMAWPGNVAVFAAIVLLVLAPSGLVTRTQRMFQGAVAPLAIGGIALVTWLLPRHPNGGSDGNYYVIPIVLAFLAVSAPLTSLSGPPRWVVAVLGGAFALSQAPLMFVSHWSWHMGTSAFSLELDKPLYGDRERADAVLKKSGAWALEAHLREHPGERRCIGFSNRNDIVLRRLSCSFEDFEELRWSFPKAFDSEEGVRAFLEWKQPDLVIFPRSALPQNGTEAIAHVFEELRTRPDVVLVESDAYVAVHFTRRGHDGAAP